MKTKEEIISSIQKEGGAIGFEQKSDRKVGALLATLCASKPNGSFLELGSGCGLSTVWMTEGMDEKSKLISVDNDAKVIDIAKKYLGNDERIEFICKSGEEVIDSIKSASIDLIFADTWPGKYFYLEEALSLLRVGGIYVIDDMLPQENWPKGHGEKAKKLLAHLKERDDFNVVQLDWATGVVIATKCREKETERVLDVGCGDGTLAVEIERRGAKVVGVDMSREMVEACKANGIEAYIGSVTALPYNKKFDAVFSNAMLHWVKDAKLAVQNIAKSLKPNGRFVCEFGGKGNAFALVSAMEEVFAKHPEFGKFENPWYFPNIDEYKALLESEGFRVEYAKLIPRPTPMDDIINWLDIFANGITKHLSKEQFETFKLECRDLLKDKLYTEKEGWVIDYVRLRVKATKIA